MMPKLVDRVCANKEVGMDGELEVGSRATWRNCVRMFMRKDGRKKWERNLVRQERYVKEFGGKGEVRLRFKLSTYHHGSWVTQRCGMCEEDECELCGEGLEDIVHFLLHCGEFVGKEENVWV